MNEPTHDKNVTRKYSKTSNRAYDFRCEICHREFADFMEASDCGFKCEQRREEAERKRRIAECKHTNTSVELNDDADCDGGPDFIWAEVRCKDCKKVIIETQHKSRDELAAILMEKYNG